MASLVPLITLSTFFDDTARVATAFPTHSESVAEGYLRDHIGDSSKWIAKFLLACGLLAQVAGTALVLCNIFPERGCDLLIWWCVLHPVLYSQVSNLEFCSETATLIGGLLILRAHVQPESRSAMETLPHVTSVSISGALACKTPRRSARQQLLGRALLPSLYTYHLFRTLVANITSREHRQSHSIEMYVVDTLLVVLLALGVAFITVGLRSRACALLLAFLNGMLLLTQHPFWRFMGAQTLAELPPVPYIESLDLSRVEPRHVVDIHRYLFFQGLSTTGALLLLALYGPGELAVEEHEAILNLPVETRKD
eukprot:CAMPEP_0119301416 /NCGR_PEP_ID=MMETSP1333-20130426/3203_1 /TAXON_ID=418940 /ORGANISM="Scyphosphaera apsteinii, Strain RCC1455" /LENGTH=310 /DNA_ID=CAMNT_0007303487 /DNA_START=200 /DNA_END=1132 /DNA_ORIENTATION=+